MNAIMGFSELLLKNGLPRQKLENFVHIVHENSKKLLSVISDILDISIIESGQFIINPELVNINNLLDELFHVYREKKELKKLPVNLICNCPNNYMEIKTDEKKVRQVIGNLLNNAIKYTEYGRIEFGYEFHQTKVADGLDVPLRFYVKDSGIGIKPEDHDLIFQRFRQAEVEKNKVNEGNGLGLSISKALVEKLGGTHFC
jgi:signal transduction histidine kinase